MLKDVVKFPVNLITSSSIRINAAQSAVLRPWQLVQIIKSINVEVIVRLFLFLFLFLFCTWFIGHIGLFLKIITAGCLNNRGPNICTLATTLKGRGAGTTILTNKVTLPATITSLLSTTSTNSVS